MKKVFLIGSMLLCGIMMFSVYTVNAQKKQYIGTSLTSQELS